MEKRYTENELPSVLWMENLRRMNNEVKLVALAQHIFMEKRRRRSINNELPSELWLDILRRIPAAHLFPLKAVCKTFHRLISDDFFARLPHLKDLITKHDPNKATRALIISTDPTTTNLRYDPEQRTFHVCRDESRFDYWCNSSHGHLINDPPLPPIPRGPRHLLIDSYNGLLLVQICDRLLLCNPITRSYIQLMICGFSQLDFGCWKIAYDDVSEKYKVFGLKIQRNNKASLYVFDVEENNVGSHFPREIATDVDVGSDVYDVVKESVLVKDKVCWLIVRKESEEKEWQTCIVSASVTTEEVKTRSCSELRSVNVICDTLFAANGTFYIGQTFIFTVPELTLRVLDGVESENSKPTWRMKQYIGSSSIASIIRPTEKIRSLGLFRDKLLIMIMPGNRFYRLCMYDLSSGDFAKAKFLRGEEFDNVTWGPCIERESRSFGPFRIVQHIDIV